MLTNLQIKDFLLIPQLDLDFFNGLSVITGETGSGKSITIDALMLIFGAKASNDLIRSNQPMASLSATFSVSNPKILAWLNERQFSDYNQPNSIICRRVIDRNGRSKSYINGQTVTLGMLKELGEMLLDIHTQHASIALLRPEVQRNLLDEFAGITPQVEQLGEKFRHLNQLKNKLNTAQQLSQDLVLKQEILQEKINNVINLNLGQTEWEDLIQEQKQLANANFTLQELDFALNILNGENNSLTELAGLISHRLNKISDYLPNFTQISQLTSSLEADISELEHELNLVSQRIEPNPQRLAIIDQRIDEIYSIGRKYRIRPEDILSTLNEWQLNLQQLNQDLDIEILQQQLMQAEQEYLHLAQIISSQRHHSAQILTQKVMELLPQLAIRGQFKVEVTTNHSSLTSNGIDAVYYLVSFNQGMGLQAMHKVASGGELSRVALALYVILSVNNPPELIVFDEIDVGIGGGVAEIVGNLLKQLGQAKQVLCITHQPQTACCGDYHLLVEKHHTDDYTMAEISYLNSDQRVQ
ncbi:MAG: repair protein RecN, partial [Pseudomonadota bacterium]